MKIRAKVIEMEETGATEQGVECETEFTPPEGAVDVAKGIAVVNNVPCLVVTWIELTNEERRAIMLQQQAQGSGLVLR